MIFVYGSMYVDKQSSVHNYMMHLKARHNKV